MPEEKKQENPMIKIPKEWLETGFTCTMEVEDRGAGREVVRFSCSPLSEAGGAEKKEGEVEKAQDRLVGEVIRQVITIRGHVIGDWKEKIGEWIEKCIMSGGLPMFRTRFAGARWDDDKVMAVCYGSEEPPISGGFFTGVPKDEIEKMEQTTGDWRWIVDKYGSSELKAYVHEKYKPPKIGLVRLLSELSKRG
jgi:hypothetical protein